MEKQTQKIMKKYGVKYGAVFVPKEQSEEKWPKMNWNITLKNNIHNFVIPYMESCVNVEYTVRGTENGKYHLINEARKFTCETGYTFIIDSESNTIQPTNKKQPLPKIHDVLCQLIYGTNGATTLFKDWCENYGFNPDSRQALQVYIECQEIYRNLRLLFSEKGIQELMTIFVNN